MLFKTVSILDLLHKTYSDYISSFNIDIIIFLFLVTLNFFYFFYLHVLVNHVGFCYDILMHVYNEFRSYLPSPISLSCPCILSLPK